MVIKQDCPICGRKGNPGHVNMCEDDKKAVTFETIVGGIAGFLIGGPVGAALGATGANKGTSWIAKRFNQTTDDGFVIYRFNCQNPNCKHTWTSKVKE